MRNWRILGRTSRGLVSITIEAHDHDEAVREAEGRGISVESCVLIEYNVYGVKQ